MSLISRPLSALRALLQSPADRRLAAEVDAWERSPGPSRSRASAPFSGDPQPPGNAPGVNWRQYEPEPSPRSYAYREGYSNHTYANATAPVMFEGFNKSRIDNAVALHRRGNFYESSALMVSILSFAPLLAALNLAVAPILALRRHIHGGDKGLAKMVTVEVEEQIAPRGGLIPSPYFPPELWGTTFNYLRVMGFVVFQHVDGDPDPETGVRPRYTRIWEPWAVRVQRSPRKWIAITTEGEIEIKNDGKFTLVQDENEGYLSGAIAAVGNEVLGAKITQEARLSWLDFFGDPKIYLTLPEKIATRGEAGDQFAAAAEDFYGPGGHAVFPFGTKAEAVTFSGEGSKAFADALRDHIIHIGMVFVGSEAPLMKGSGGVYTAPIYEGVRLDLIRRPAACVVRGINGGHIAPYCDTNYPEQIKAAKRAGTWRYPTLGIELPDPAQDARIASIVEREKSLVEQIVAERAAGIVVDQPRVEHLAKSRNLEKAPQLAEENPKGADFYEWEMMMKLAAPDEFRARKGLPPLPDGIGSVERLAEERRAGKDEVGKAASTVDPSAPSADPLDGGEPVPAGKDGGGRCRT